LPETGLRSGNATPEQAAPQTAALPRDAFDWCGEAVDYWARRTPDAPAAADADGPLLSYAELEAALAETQAGLTERGL